MFRLPFVSRERFEEMKADKDRRISDLERDNRKIIDYLHLMSLGRPVFEPVAVAEEVKAGVTTTPPTPDDLFQTDLKEAHDNGYTKPRQVADYISRKNASRARDAQVRSTTDAKALINVESAMAEFDKALETGEQENA